MGLALQQPWLVTDDHPCVSDGTTSVLDELTFFLGIIAERQECLEISRNLASGSVFFGRVAKDFHAKERHVSSLAPTTIITNEPTLLRHVPRGGRRSVEGGHGNDSRDRFQRTDVWYSIV